MKESETVKEYYHGPMKVINQIRLHGEKLLDNRIVEKVLVSVPKRKAIRLEESIEGAFQAKLKDKHGNNNFGK
ncbi:hypothetical protein PVK06_047748 [Gossypium arboreum]|uniref:Uncharacterized protein n=1 Tax=Gossypium arboreum TaxID=29729 RepID=A0ABR0ME37_GOSAR|nr:hypothetical protein PVK06_047748 [Gossypium arboreum]